MIEDIICAAPFSESATFSTSGGDIRIFYDYAILKKISGKYKLVVKKRNGQITTYTMEPEAAKTWAKRHMNKIEWRHEFGQDDAETE